MSHHSRRAYSSTRRGLDYYKILRVARDASLSDIKVSYRKLAMEFHPDRHDGCSNKEAQFKQINEAYSVLVDAARKRQYDRDFMGGQSHGFRTKSSSGSWQHSKVYAPSPPPEWKNGVWNHRMHYEYHYGDGFQQEAFRRMRQEAKKEGAFDYQSPLGRGFTFQQQDDNKDNDKDNNTNPYSKAQQGPPKIVMEYEEIERDMVSGREHVSRRERVVEDLYRRRQERYTSSDSRQKQKQNAAFVRERPNNNECVIM